MLEPVSKTRVSQAAIKSIKSYIADYGLKPGDKLPTERQMSKALKISRTSVREALRILEIVGILEVKPGSGIYFKDATGDLTLPLSMWLPDNEETLFEVLEIRQLIEPRAANLAAERITPHDLENIQDCLERFCQCVEENDLPGMILEDTQFHRLLAEASKNKTLTLLMNTITRFLPLAWKATLRVPQRPQKTVAEHQNIYNAIKNHDPVLASQAMVLHLENALAELNKIFNGHDRALSEID